MRIARIAPLAESVPPKLYGGTERVVAWLVDELVALGHDVTLFASGDSRTHGKLHPVWPRALRLGRPAADPMVACAALLEAMSKRAKDFDVIHAHIDWVHLPLLSRLAVPFLTTMHGRLVSIYLASLTWLGSFRRPLSCQSQTISVCRLQLRTGAARSIPASRSTYLVLRTSQAPIRPFWGDLPGKRGLKAQFALRMRRERRFGSQQKSLELGEAITSRLWSHKLMASISNLSAKWTISQRHHFLQVLRLYCFQSNGQNRSALS